MSQNKTTEQAAEEITAQIVLDKQDLHWTYEPITQPGRIIHDCDCRFCEVEDRVILAMEEYADQQTAHLSATIEEQKAEIERYRNPWISVDYAYPEISGAYLTAFINKDGSYIEYTVGYLYHRRDGSYCFTDSSGDISISVTHWMPLPPAPQTKEQKEE